MAWAKTVPTSTLNLIFNYSTPSRNRKWGHGQTKRKRKWTAYWKCLEIWHFISTCLFRGLFQVTDTAWSSPMIWLRPSFMEKREWLAVSVITVNCLLAYYMPRFCVSIHNGNELGTLFLIYMRFIGVYQRELLLWTGLLMSSHCW